MPPQSWFDLQGFGRSIVVCWSVVDRSWSRNHRSPTCQCKSLFFCFWFFQSFLDLLVFILYITFICVHADGQAGKYCNALDASIAKIHFVDRCSRRKWVDAQVVYTRNDWDCCCRHSDLLAPLHSKGLCPTQVDYNLDTVWWEISDIRMTWILAL
jgi:hypothetical protein